HRRHALRQRVLQRRRVGRVDDARQRQKREQLSGQRGPEFGRLPARSDHGFSAPFLGVSLSSLRSSRRSARNSLISSRICCKSCSRRWLVSRSAVSPWWAWSASVCTRALTVARSSPTSAFSA